LTSVDLSVESAFADQLDAYSQSNEYACQLE
jgi:hypothetical protein